MLENGIKYIAVFLFVFAVACNQMKSARQDVIAQVGEKQLFASEVNEVVPHQISREDSLILANDYVTKWVKRQLMLQKAEENLSLYQKDLTKELEEYRNSLIIYRYKNELMKQRMDTTVSEDQVQEYYEANTENFKLNKNIVKAIFIKIPNEFANPAQLKEMCSDISEEGINELRAYCLQYAKGFDIFTDSWVDFELVIKNIPEDIENPERFLTQNNKIELTDSGYYYLVTILDYKLKNELAPVEFVKGNIVNLLLNQRKIEFLKNLENNVYTEGVRTDKFKIIKRDANEIN